MDDHRKRIVIVGGGFAGAYCAQALEALLDTWEAEIILINRSNYFTFYPLLVEAGTGSLEPRHAVVSIRSFLKTTVFRMARVVGIDTERQAVTYRFNDGRTEMETYDQLVLALGSTTRMPDIPGLSDFAYPMKSLADAMALRDRAIEMLELADAARHEETRQELLHFVVVGANFTGVEVAGELDFFLRKGSRHYPGLGIRNRTITLVEQTDRILGALDADLADYAKRRLQERNIDLRLRDSVSRIERDRVHLQGGEILRTQTVIWTAGISPNPLTRETALPTDPLGYILCERDLRVEGQNNVWAIGDCAVNPDESGKAYPATAQHAIQQGKWLARNLAAELSGRAAQPCNITSKGSLAALGCRTGVAMVLGFKLSGFPAWWLWRTVYLIRMPTWARRIRIALDWTIDLLFPSDFVQLGVLERKHDSVTDSKRE